MRTLGRMRDFLLYRCVFRREATYSQELSRKLSQKLRKNMTKEERHLWYDFFKTYPIQFKRQYTIGPYIADFYVIEQA